MEITSVVNYGSISWQISATINGIRHRLVNLATKEEGKWATYGQLATLQPDKEGRMWACGTDYWKGVFPTEMPFMVIPATYIVARGL